VCFTGNAKSPKANKKKKQNNKRNKIIKCCGKQSCYGPKNIVARNKTLIKLKEKKEFTTSKSTAPKKEEEEEAEENVKDPVENEPPAETEPPSTSTNRKDAPKEGANFYFSSIRNYSKQF